MDIQTELLDVVNGNDEVIGQDLKSNKIAKGFISRVAAVFLADSEGKFIITKRSEQKMIDPGLYDLAAVGSVVAGENYEAGARRELHEELSIVCELESLDKFYQEIDHEKGKLKFFCAVFLGRTDQLPKLNDEVAGFVKMSLDEIKKEIGLHPEKFCPGFLNDFRQVEEKLVLKILR
ncbi:MAG: NUDIX domain-containing protein [Candidatus Moranbacteria bacterium]|nr:NUDIX domain-containing protein [Candidatus Moranbacteria bacterium]